MSESATSSRRVQATEREGEAIMLRIAGHSYRQIGVALGITSSGAFRAVSRGLGRLEKTSAESAELLRRLEGERLDALWRACWPLVERGDMQAAGRCVSISAARCRLYGLDRIEPAAPTTGGTTEILWPHECKPAFDWAGYRQAQSEFTETQVRHILTERCRMLGILPPEAPTPASAPPSPAPAPAPTPAPKPVPLDESTLREPGAATPRRPGGNGGGLRGLFGA